MINPFYPYFIHFSLEEHFKDYFGLNSKLCVKNVTSMYQLTNVAHALFQKLC